MTTDCTDPYINLGTEEALTFSAQDDEVIMYLWQNAHTIVIGRNQNPWRECNVERIKQDGVYLARRISGGGAVYHDMGNLNFTFIAKDDLYDIGKQTDVILLACRLLGIDAEKNGRNDLTVDEKKFSGHAYFSSNGYNYHHGTIMMNVNPEDMPKYLRVSEAKLKSKGVSSVRSRVTNLNNYLPEMSDPELIEMMKDALIQIINEKVMGQNDFELLINGKKKSKTTKYFFEIEGEYKVSFKFKNKLNSLYELFYGIDKLTEIDLSGINLESFSNMTRIFANCENLKKIIFGKDTKKVDYIEEAFSGCSSLNELDLSSFNTHNVLDMSSLFSGCHSLSSIDITILDTQNVENLEAMFSGCYSLESINLTNLFLEKVKDMSYMFSNCEKLVNISFGNSNTGVLNRMVGMFMDCFSLENIDLHNFDTQNVKDMSLLFSNCIKLEKIDIDESKFNTKSVNNMYKMFSNCQSIKRLNLKFTTNNVKNMKEMFYNCTSLAELNAPFKTSKVIYFERQFANCSSLTKLDLKTFQTNEACEMKYMFSGCSSLISLNIENFVAKKLNNVNYMFEGCTSLKNIDLSFLRDSKSLMYTTGMFKNCISLETINFPNIYTFFLFETKDMFYGCGNLTSIDFNNLNTLSVKNMERMFYNCSSLNELNIGNFNTRSVENYEDIFYGIENSNSVNIRYNKNKTQEIEDAIMENWNKTFIS